MNEDTDSFGTRTKACFVLLKRLDNETLSRHLQKDDISLRTPVVCEHSQKERMQQRKGRSRLLESYLYAHKAQEEIRDESKNARGAAVKDNSRRRKRRIRARPLYYTDDEDELILAGSKENVSEKTGADKPAPLLEGFRNSETKKGRNKTPDKSSGNERWEPPGKKMNVLISKNILEDSLKKTTCAEKQPKPLIQASKVLSQKDKQNSGKIDHTLNTVSNNDNDNNDVFKPDEKEVIGEREKCSGFEMKVNWDKGSMISKKAVVASVQKQDFGYDDSDSRDDGEDDRATVLFDFEEVCEKPDENLRSVEKKFPKKKITNRKKGTLVKFKRKRSMVGRNLAKVKKLKNKNSASCASGEEFADKAAESVNERYVQDVSDLVKRLHELYVIILQLQKDLPTKSEQTGHLIRAINAQQEKFYKEIKKTQQTVIRSYSKILSSFGNASNVSKEIGKRTSLSKEDVTNVISQCNLLERCEETKATEDEEKQPNSSQKLSPEPFGPGGNSKKLRKLSNDKKEMLFPPECEQKVPLQTVREEQSTNKGSDNAFNPVGVNITPVSICTPVSISPPHTPHSSENPRLQKPLPRPNNKPGLANKTNAGENYSAPHFPQLHSGSVYGTSLPHRNNFQAQWLVHSKQGSYFCPQKSCTQRTYLTFGDARLGSFPQNAPLDVPGNHIRPLSSRPVHAQSPNMGPQSREDGFLPYGSGTTAVNYPFSCSASEFFQTPGGFVPPELIAVKKSPRSHIPSLKDINPYPSGYNQERLAVSHFSQVSNPSSLGISFRPRLPLLSLARSRHGSVPSQPNRCQKNPNYWIKPSDNLQRPKIPPLSNGFECSVSGASGRAFAKEEQIDSGTTLTNSARFSEPKTLMKSPAVTLPPGNPEQNNSLSAEPAIKSESVEIYTLDPTVPQKLTMRNCRLEAGPILELRNESSKAEAGENCPGESPPLNSRVYVCAQNGCKNSGIRICKGCLSIIYCSETCQLKHWSLKHRTECHLLKELRE